MVMQASPCFICSMQNTVESKVLCFGDPYLQSVDSSVSSSREHVPDEMGRLQQKPNYDSCSHSSEDPSHSSDALKNHFNKISSNHGLIRPSTKHAHKQDFFSHSSPRMSPMSTRAYNRKDYEYITSFPWSPKAVNYRRSEEGHLQDKGYKIWASTQTSINFPAETRDYYDNARQNLHNAEVAFDSSNFKSFNHINSDHKLHNTEVEFSTENLSLMQKRLHDTKMEADESDTNNLESPNYKSSESRLHNTEVELDIESLSHMQNKLHKEFHTIRAYQDLRLREGEFDSAKLAETSLESDASFIGDARILNVTKDRVAEEVSPVESDSCKPNETESNVMVSEFGTSNGLMSSPSGTAHTTIFYRIQDNESQKECDNNVEISSESQKNGMFVLKNNAVHEYIAIRPAISHLSEPVLEQSSAGNDNNLKSTSEETKEQSEASINLSANVALQKSNASIPVFGIWNCEASSPQNETYTHVFEKVREKKRGGLPLQVSAPHEQQTPVNKEKRRQSQEALTQATTPIIKHRLTIAKSLQHAVAHDKKPSSIWSLCFLAPMTIE